MNFKDTICSISRDIGKSINKTKNSNEYISNQILPIIEALGYDIDDPNEVSKEYAINSILVNEKVDYAVLDNKKVLFLIKIMPFNAPLDANQTEISDFINLLSSCSAKVGAVTNGINWNFYSDPWSDNKIDSGPFFKFNITSIKSYQISMLEMFQKGQFDHKRFTPYSKKIMNRKEVSKILIDELKDPSDEFVNFILTKGPKKSASDDEIKNVAVIVADSANDVFQEKINEALTILWSNNNPDGKSMGSKKNEDDIVKEILSILSDILQ